MTDGAEDFRALVRRVRAEKKLDLEDVAFDARTALGARAVSLSLIQKRLAPSSSHEPTVDLMETLAAGLGIAPDEFAEYRLALARRELDPGEVGLDQALRMLERIEKAMRPRRAASRREAERSQATDPPQPAGRPARRSPREG